MAFSIGDATYDDPAVGFEATPGQVWFDIQSDTGDEMAMEVIKSSGVSGSTIRWHNFSGREASVEVAYIAGSAGDCLEAIEDDRGSVLGAIVSVTLPGGSTLQGWVCKRIRQTSTPKDTGYGTFMMRAVVEIERVQKDE